MSLRRTLGEVLVAAALATTTVVATLPQAPVQAAAGSVAAGWVVRVPVPDAIGGKTVIGQLTVDRATEPGFVTAYGCDDGIPTSSSGTPTRSDVNFDGRVTPAASNRLIVQADADGDVCFYTSARVDIIVDVNAVSFDVGINSFPNRRTDTRVRSGAPQVAAGGVVRVAVPEAVGGKTVIGQLTVDRVTDTGYVTAYGCDDGAPIRSDVNYDGRVMPAASNRLIVQADAAGNVCFRTSAQVDMIIDLNATADVGIRSFPNRRTDTRVGFGGTPQVPAGGVVRIAVPEAVGGKTVIGQLTVDRATATGYVTAYGCDDGRFDEIRPQLRRTRHARRIEPADRPGGRGRQRVLPHDGRGRPDRRPQRRVRRGHHLVPQPADRHPHGNDDGRIALGGSGTGVAALHPGAGAQRYRRADRSPGGRRRHEPADRGGQDRQLPARPAAGEPRARRRDHRGERRRRHALRRPVPDQHRRGRPRALGPHVRSRSAHGHEPAGLQILGCQRRRHGVGRIGRPALVCSSTSTRNARRATGGPRIDRRRTTCSSTSGARSPPRRPPGPGARSGPSTGLGHLRPASRPRTTRRSP